MPYLHIQISGAEDAPLGQRVAASATELTSRLLGKNASHTAVVVDFIGSGRWFIAGQPVADGVRSYHWMVSITDETNTRAEKAAYLAAVQWRTCAAAPTASAGARRNTARTIRCESRRRADLRQRLSSGSSSS